MDIDAAMTTICSKYEWNITLKQKQKDVINHILKKENVIGVLCSQETCRNPRYGRVPSIVYYHVTCQSAKLAEHLVGIVVFTCFYVIY